MRTISVAFFPLVPLPGRVMSLLLARTAVHLGRRMAAERFAPEDMPVVEVEIDRLGAGIDAPHLHHLPMVVAVGHDNFYTLRASHSPIDHHHGALFRHPRAVAVVCRFHHGTRGEYGHAHQADQERKGLVSSLHRHNGF